MSSVQISHKGEDGGEFIVAVVDGDVMKAHSKTVRDMIASKDQPEVIYKIVLSGPTFEALKFVIEQVVNAAKKKKVLDINLGPRGISQALPIHRAIKCLRIEPEQLQVPSRINNLLARNLVTVTEMLAIHAAYGSEDNPHGKLFTTMVTTTAWKFVNDDKMKQGQKRQLSQASQTQPDLLAAIITKVAEFEEMKRVRLIIAEKRAKKEEKRRLAAEQAWGPYASEEPGW